VQPTNNFDVQSPALVGEKSCKLKLAWPQTPTKGDTTSQLVLQAAGIEWVTGAPLDQESPG